MDCGFETVGGNPASGGGAGFSQLFQASVTTSGAVVGTINLGTLPARGDRIILRGFEVSSIFTAGAAAGDIGQDGYAGSVMAQSGTTDAQVLVWGTQPWGPPPGTPILQPTSVGYQPPLTFGSPGGLAIVINVLGTTLRFQVTGIGGFDIRTDIIGEIYLFGTSTRLV